MVARDIPRATSMPNPTERGRASCFSMAEVLLTYAAHSQGIHCRHGQRTFSGPSAKKSFQTRLDRETLFVSALGDRRTEGWMMHSDTETPSREECADRPSMDADGAPTAAGFLRSEDSSMERVLDLLSNILETGDLDGVDHWLDVMAAELAGMESERQKERLRKLRTALGTEREREAASGGPGSLFDAQHPFAVMVRREGERARVSPALEDTLRKGGRTCNENSRRMHRIERHIGIGDSILAHADLERWSPGLEVASDASLLARLQRARMRLDGLQAYEAVHGRLSLLNRASPEILQYIRINDRMGISSIYS